MVKETFFPSYYKKEVPRSGFQEAKLVFGDFLVTEPGQLRGKMVFFGDGSTSVCNLRGVEVVATLIAVNTLNGIASGMRIVMVGGGTAYEAARDLGVNLESLSPPNPESLEKLKELFPGVIFDEGNRNYLPPEAFQGEEESTLREMTLRKREEILRVCMNILGISTLPIKVSALEEFPNIQGISLGNILENEGSNPRGVVVKFICPDCSRQRGEPVEHGITPSKEVIRTNGGKRVGCKAAIALRKGFEEGNLLEKSLSELVKNGFYLSGRVLYQIIISALNPETDALLIRNYSNSRGVMEAIGRIWKGSVGITRRYYFQGKREIPGVEIPRLLQVVPKLKRAILEDPLLVVIPEGDFILPC